MTEYKTIKGQAWIEGEALVQEQVMLIPGKSAITNVVALIPNIWEDLTSNSGTYFTGVKKAGYFYWEVTMTDSENDEVEITTQFECPRPKDGLFTEPYDPDSVSGDYAKYWVAKMKEASENYEKAYAIQRKEILLKGTEYYDTSIEAIKSVDDIVETNSNLGDITSLLGLF